jgi:STAM-binding protein
VHVSVGLMEQFLAFAASNTARGVETCGILVRPAVMMDFTVFVTPLMVQ